MAKAKDRVADVTPYVKRAIQDEELRESLRSAFTTARDVYDELLGGRGVTAVASKVASDQEIQDQLRSAIEDLRSAANRIQGKEEHKGRNTSLLLVGIGLGILFTPAAGPKPGRGRKNKILGENEEWGSGSGNRGTSS